MDEQATAAYPLPAIPYLRLRVELRSGGAAKLPEFKGSMLRGAFGHALRRAVCSEGPKQACGGCELRASCLYTRCFETFVGDRPTPFSKGLEESPRPYVFEPHSARRRFAPGDPLVFDLLLLGQAAGLQSLVVLALERMARGGLSERRHRFTLERVDYLAAGGAWRTGYRRGRQAWSADAPPLLPAAPESAPRRLELRLATPTRVLRNQVLLPRFRDFRSLVERMLHRVLDLAHFHVPGAAVDWTFRPLLDRAAAVTIERQDLAVRTLERYSNRQQQRHPLQGLVGRLTLTGDLAPFLPLLRTAEIVHVGKSATFGLGKVEVGW